MLGLSRSASTADVRHAFRSAARACHPDKGGEAGAFAAVRAAYQARAGARRGEGTPRARSHHGRTQVLSDPAQRAAYDDLGGDLKWGRRGRDTRGRENLSWPLTRQPHAATSPAFLTAPAAASPRCWTSWSDWGWCASPPRSWCACARCARASTRRRFPVCALTTRRCAAAQPPRSATCAPLASASSARASSTGRRAGGTHGIRVVSLASSLTRWPRQGAFGLHFPVHNTPHLAEKLGRRQLEAKRVEDGERAARAVPHFRSDGELKELRAFKEAAAGCLPHAGAGAPQAMQRYYCWAQTAELLLLAVHVPTGYEDRQLRWEVTAQLLVVQAEDSAAVIERTLSHPLAPGAQVDAFVSQDNRLLTLVMRKAALSHWRSLFRGDSAGDRCIQPPYELLEADHDVVMEWRLPAWVQAAHLRVDVTQEGLTVDVDARRGAERRASGGGSGGDDAAFALQRTFWKDPDSGVRRTSEPVSPEQCSWSLCDAAGEARGPAGGQEAATNDKLLTVLFVKPPLTDDERQFMKGRRADNRAANGGGPVAQRGARFFVDDADDFGLEDILQALCFFLTGTAYVAPKPHQAYGQPAARAFWASSEAQLSQAARQQLQLLMAAKGEEQEATQLAPSRTRA